MSNIVRLQTEDATIRGQARACLSKALALVDDPTAVVVIVLSDNDFSMRCISDADSMREFDMFSRAIAMLDRQRGDLIG